MHFCLGSDLSKTGYICVPETESPTKGPKAASDIHGTPDPGGKNVVLRNVELAQGPADRRTLRAGWVQLHFNAHVFASLWPPQSSNHMPKTHNRTSLATRSSLRPAHDDTAACAPLPYPLRHSPWPHIMMCWQDAKTFLVHGWFQT